MSTELPDRPTSLRRVPRPAPDESVDPVDYVPATAPTFQAAPQPTAAVEQATPQPAAPRAPKATQPRKSPSAAATPAPAVSADTSAPKRLGRPRGRELTVPFSTRIAIDISEIIDDVAAREGLTIRSVVEQAIQDKWGRPTSS